MKICVIGDVHGTKYWKSFLNNIDEYDYVIQLGDWFDDWHNDWDNCNQVDNFLEAIDYKKKYYNKFYILIGNHDLNSYIMGEDMSGKQNKYLLNIKNALLNNMDYMDMCVEKNGYVFSHAGFSKTWMKNNNYFSLEDVNNYFHSGIYYSFKFYGYDLSGNDITQGPTWIRPEALLSDSYFKKQVVGHTSVKNYPEIRVNDDENVELIIVDSIDHKAFYIMDIK